MVRFLSVFLASNEVMAWFLNLGTVVNTPRHPGIPPTSCSSRHGSTWYDRKAAQVWPFLAAPAQVDDDTSKHHLSASNYGRENEWVLLDPLAPHSEPLCT